MTSRRGLVLGGGGILGAAWMVGALCGLEEELGPDLRDVELLVGTSAGSVLGALLAAGLTPRELVAHQREEGPIEGLLAGVASDYGVSGVRPVPPRIGIGSTRLLRTILRSPRAHRMPAVSAALLPRGRAAMGPLPSLIDTLLPTWPAGSGRPELAVCAMDFATGERQVFGSATPQVQPSVAITASCAVPGWFAPVPIEKRFFVDGGSYSFTSLDVAAGHGLDEVYVLAPLAHVARVAGSATVGDRLLRQWRLPQTRQMYAEAEVVRREGTKVRLVAPDAEDLAALGRNPMKVDRRLSVLETALRRVP